MGLQRNTASPTDGTRASGTGGRPRGARRSRALAACLAVGLTVTVAGCTTHKKPDDAPIKALAGQLASSLQTGSLNAVPVVGTDPATATKQRRSVFAALPVAPTISVVSVTRDPAHKDQATAKLQWSWGVLTGHPWTYATTVQLEQNTPGATATSTGSAGGTSGATAPATPAANLDGWSVRWDPTALLPDLVEGEHVEVSATTPKRADILDANGTAIVKDRAVHVIGVDKTLAKGATAKTAARALATKLEIDPDAYAKQVAAAGPKAFVAAITLRTDDPTNVDALASIKGVRVVDDSMPLGPTHEWARPLLGSVGPATADIVKASDGRIRAGDQTGTSGIEKQYDAQLAGTRGIDVTLHEDAKGDALVQGDGAGDGGASAKGVLFRVATVDGSPVKLTLQSALQTDAENILADQKVPAAIVAIDTKGNVLAAASAAAGNGLSTAMTGQYAPGSTFKVASSLALLRAGDTTTTKVSCPMSVNVSGKVFKDDPDFPQSGLGQVTLRSAFANSCNTAFVGQASKVSQKQLASAAADLGIGVPSNLGVPAFFGSVPLNSTGTDHAASLMGQGRVEASPFTMATVAASVAAGKRVSPMLVESKSITSAETTADPTAAPTGTATAGATSTSTPSPTTSVAPSKLTASETKTLHSLMRSVVTDGTGTVLSSLPGDVAAKTGTAQYGDDGKVHAWMIAADGDVGVAVFVEDGSYGATTSGPLLKEFLQDLAQDRTK